MVDVEVHELPPDMKAHRDARLGLLHDVIEDLELLQRDVGALDGFAVFEICNAHGRSSILRLPAVSVGEMEPDRIGYKTILGVMVVCPGEQPRTSSG